MDKTVTCIGCPMGCPVTVSFDEAGNIAKVSGNTCKRGDDYARKEVANPMRIVTSIVKVENGDTAMLSVKTNADIPKNMIFDCMKEINKVTVHAPVMIGDIIIKDVHGTGVDVVATKNINKVL